MKKGGTQPPLCYALNTQFKACCYTSTIVIFLAKTHNTLNCKITYTSYIIDT